MQDSDAESSGTGSRCGSFFSAQVQRPPWQQLQDAPSSRQEFLVKAHHKPHMGRGLTLYVAILSGSMARSSRWGRLPVLSLLLQKGEPFTAVTFDMSRAGLPHVTTVAALRYWAALLCNR